MNSKDLRAVEHIGRLLEIGVDALKIEGRTYEEAGEGRAA
jgi:putative protease